MRGTPASAEQQHNESGKKAISERTPPSVYAEAAGDQKKLLLSILNIAASHLPEEAGTEVDAEVTWESSGFNSVSFPALIADLTTLAGRPLEPSVLIDHPTASSLAAYLAAQPAGLGAEGTADERTASLRACEAHAGEFCAGGPAANGYFRKEAYAGAPLTSPMLWQPLAIALLVALLGGCGLPPALAYDRLMHDARIPVYPWKALHSGGFGLAVTVVLVLFSACFTAAVVLLKWILIGRYRPSALAVGSPAYMRWWFVNSCVRVWEELVGRNLVGTPWLGLVYLALGARLPARLVLSGGVRCFVRDFDLFRCAKSVRTLCGPTAPRRSFTPGLLSTHGVWLDTIELCSAEVGPYHAAYPGYREARPSSRRGAPAAGDASAEPIDWLDVAQRWTAPGVLIGIAWALVLLVDEWGVSLLFVDVYTGTTLSAALQGLLSVLAFHLLLLAIMLSGLVLARHFEFWGDYIVGVSFPLHAYWEFTPLTAFCIWLGGAKLNFCRVYFNSMFAPSVSKRLKIGDGTVCFSPRFDPGFSTIEVGRNCFFGIASYIKGGAIIGDGALVDTLASVSRRQQVLSKTWVTSDGLLLPVGAATASDDGVAVSKRLGCAMQCRLFVTHALIPVLLRLVILPVPSLITVGMLVVVVRESGAGVHDVPWLVALGASMVVSLSATWLALVERCAYASGSEWWAQHLAMPLFRHVTCNQPVLSLIDGSWLMAAVLRMRGARVPSVTAMQLHDARVYDARNLEFGEGVVLQQACASGHGARPDAAHPFGARLHLGRVYLGKRTIVHPGVLILEGFATRDDTVVQAFGTNVRSARIHEVGNMESGKHSGLPTVSTRTVSSSIVLEP